MMFWRDSKNIFLPGGLSTHTLLLDPIQFSLVSDRQLLAKTSTHRNTSTVEINAYSLGKHAYIFVNFAYSRLGLRWVVPHQVWFQPNPGHLRHLPSDSLPLTHLGLQRPLPGGSIAQHQRKVILTSPLYSFCSIGSNRLIAYAKFHPWYLIRPTKAECPR